MKLYQRLAHVFCALENCRKSDWLNPEWEAKWEDELERLVRERMPSGSGFDSGTKLDDDATNRNRLVFSTSFHHMDEHGGYDGWTDHVITVKPDLLWGFDLSISGRNRKEIKEYIHDVFHAALNAEAPQ